jgi:hypothetical protein
MRRGGVARTTSASMMLGRWDELEALVYLRGPDRTAQDHARHCSICRGVASCGEVLT